MRTNMGTLTVPRDPPQLSASNHGKTKDNLRPLPVCGLNQWIGEYGQATPRRIAANIAKLPELQRWSTGRNRVKSKFTFSRDVRPNAEDFLRAVGFGMPQVGV